MNVEQIKETIDQASFPERKDLITFDDVALAARELPHGTPDTSGATPLDYSKTSQRQLDLFMTFLDEFDAYLSDLVPSSVREHAINHFCSTFHARSMANMENFQKALRSHEDYLDEPVTHEMMQRAMIGDATPAEIMLVRQILGISSVELSCATFAGKDRIPLLRTMNEHVQASVEFLQGMYFDEPQDESFRVKDRILGNDLGHEQFAQGIRMTRKRTLGIMEDGTIIRERVTFILRTDKKSQLVESGLLSSAGIAAMAKLDQSNSEYGKLAARISGLDEAAKVFLGDCSSDGILLVSSEIYAYNKATKLQVVKKMEDEEAVASGESESVPIPEIQKQREEHRKKFPMAHLQDD